MSGSRRRSARKKAKKKGNLLRYLTFAVVILAVAGLGVFFFTNNFNTTLLPILGKVTGPSPTASWTATLLYGDETGVNLIKEHRIITSGQTPEKKADALLQELLKGPISRGTPTLPRQTHVLGVSFDGGVLTADFSPELKRNHPGGTAAELLTVYSVVNTITGNIPEIRQVRFLIEGKKIDNIAGHIDCRKPISPRPDTLR